MSLPFRPSITLGESDPFNFSLPLLPWTERSSGIGGHAVSAAGIPEAYSIRTDRIARIVLRVDESELATLLPILEEIRDGAREFVFSFDQDDGDTEFTVYLVSPVWPDDLTPERDEQFRSLFRLTIEIRTVDGTPFDLSWTEVEA